MFLAALAVIATGIAACGSGGGEDLSAWDHDPIVPGYSMADVNIGDPFQAVLDIHGEPEQKLKDGGYLYAYYARTREGGRIDDPASWRMVVTLYDNGNGYLDAEDEVGAIEVSTPYYGTTSGGVGIGSSPGDVEGEFGPCESISETQGPEGENIQLYYYDQKGVEFLISPPDGAITVLVTAYGGLRPVEEEEGTDDAQGGLFGVYSSAPIVPGQTAAGINVGDEFRTVKEKYGGPDSTGSTTEGLVFATYTGGYGTWKMNVYMEDMDKNDSLGDFDIVVSISVRHPYEGKTPMGVGIGSPSADAMKEFGSPERQTSLMHQGEELTIMEYNAKGIVFAFNSASGAIVEIDVNRPLTQ
ncbi:MAG: hypothetical protein C4536_12775 [Actinobacteria bacterium]|nr:MAG: hypothetical protein C4536_12775 [Actinomycetota bacterium]